MKKLSLQLLLLPIIALMLSSCENAARKALALSIEQQQKTLPVSLGSLGSFTTLSYDEADNTVTMGYEINENIRTIENIAKSDTQQRQYLTSFLKSDDIKPMTALLVKADASLEIIFRGIQSNEEYTIHFSADDLKKINDAPETSQAENGREQITSIVESENVNCPMQIDENTIFESAKLVGDYIEYRFNLSGIGDITISEEMAEMMKEQNRQALKSLWDGRSGRHIKDLYYKNNVGIKYIYTNTDNGNSCTITFTPQEIYKL